MTGGQTLALILTILYLSECILWLGKHTRVLLRWVGRWRLLTGNTAFGSSQSGAVILNPLPPLSEAFRTDDLPLWLSPQGAVSADAESAPFIPLTETTKVHSNNKNVLVNDVPFCSCASAHQAYKVAELLTQVAQAAPSARTRIIRDFWRSRLDLTAAQERIKQVRAATRILRFLCNAQWLVIFLIGLLFAINPELYIPLFSLLILMLGLVIAIATIYFPAARRLYPKDTEDRITHLIKIIVCAPLSIRACDFLTLPATNAFESVAVELALLDTAQANTYFARQLREIQYPLADVSGEAEEVLRWHQTELLSLMEKLGKQAGLDPEKWAEDVTPEGGSLSYCPRCLCQFTYSKGTCQDCPGISVQSFPQTDTAKS